MNRFMVKRIVNTSVMILLGAGFVLVVVLQFFPSTRSSQMTSTLIWCFWLVILVGIVVRVILGAWRPRRADDHGPVAAAGESIQDMYLGRVIHEDPGGDVDGYSAIGSPPPRDGDDFLPEHTKGA